MTDTNQIIKQYLTSLHRAGVSHVTSPVIDAELNAKLEQLQAEMSVPATTPTKAHAKEITEATVTTAKEPAETSMTRQAEEPKPDPKPVTQSEPTLVKESPVFTGEKSDSLTVLQNEVVNCTQCSELAATRTQTVFGIGNPNARLLFLGEAPGADEDQQGEPFVGAAGQKLTEILEKGMKLSRDDVYIMNVLKCRPPGNRNPTSEEADSCRGFLDRQLQIVQPEFICCLGGVAATNLLRSKLTIGKLRGKFHDYNGIKVIATYHPVYLLRNPSARKQVWEDIKMLMAEMKTN